MTDAEYAAYRASLSMQRYSDLPVLKKPSGERVPEWVCTCPGRKPWQRHTDPRGCIPAADVAAWRKAHPDATCGDSTARILLWLEREFSR